MVVKNYLLSSTNFIRVVKSPDNYLQGNTYIGDNNLSTGQKMITGVNGHTNVAVGCKEYDTNGGDCDIKGILFCYSDTTIQPVTQQNSTIENNLENAKKSFLPETH